MIHKFNSKWDKKSVVKTGQYPWHGSWSIGEYNGTIMYAEYSTAEDTREVAVWRSMDDGETWSIVFKQNSVASSSPEIRHFHTLQPDPYNLGHWYLSSGDLPKHCKIWRSIDNGSNWEEITDFSPRGTNNQAVHRYTAIQFDEEYLYWGTDDIMDGEAKFVRAKRGKPLRVEVLGSCGNQVRNLVKTKYGLVIISQAKRHNATLYLSSDYRKVIKIGSIANPYKYKSVFVWSKGSIASRNEKFFTFNDGKILFPGISGILEWEIRFEH